jgi:hypothetical protein
MLGIGVRCVQKMAASGQLPGAARIGKLWTFDPAKIDAYLADAEAKCQNQIFTNATEFGGCELPLTGAKSAKAYDAAMSKLLGGSGIQGLSNSRKRDQVCRKQLGKTP